MIALVVRIVEAAIDAAGFSEIVFKQHEKRLLYTNCVSNVKSLFIFYLFLNDDPMLLMSIYSKIQILNIAFYCFSIVYLLLAF